MVSPGNGQTICGTRAIVAFSGYTLTGNEQVELEATDSATGSFAVFARTTTSATPTTYQGTTLYPWTVYATVPRWSGTASSSTRNSYIRARLSSDTTLATFDVGRNWRTCIDRAVAAGSTVSAAFTSCRSSTSPVVTLSAPGTAAPSSITGNVAVRSLADAERFGCVSDVTGDVSIVSDVTAPITTQLDLTLPYLATVSGNASLEYLYPGTVDPFVDPPTVPPTFATQKLVSVPLRHVGGDLSVSCRRSGASNTKPLDFGLPNLTFVGGELRVDGAAYKELRGFPMLTRSPRNVAFTTSGEVFNANGLLPALTRIDGSLTVNYAFSIANSFMVVTDVTGNVLLDRTRPTGMNGNPWSALAALARVGGGLTIRNASSRRSDPILPNLRSVTGSLQVLDSEFTGLSMGATPVGTIPSLAVGALEISSNANLLTIASHTISVAAAGPVTIRNNGCLPALAVAAFLAEQSASGWAGRPPHPITA